MRFWLTYTLIQPDRITDRSTLWRHSDNGWQILDHQGMIGPNSPGQFIWQDSPKVSYNQSIAILKPLDIITMLKPLIQESPRTLTALEAQGIANDFLSDCLPDRFTADQPTQAESRWRVPVILAYPIVGAIGEVGELWIDAIQAQVVGHTPLEAMKQIGMKLYIARQDEIEAAFS